MLSDGQILECIELGRIEIDPFSEENLTPNGYDLCLGGIEMNDMMVEPNIYKKYRIPPFSAFRVLTMERIMVTNMIAANLYLKSWFTRRGILASLSQVDAGFPGSLTLGCFNGNETSFEIDWGIPFCQIVFTELDELPIKSYVERSGHYKNQGKKVIK
jgi:dCTP deaminase